MALGTALIYLAFLPPGIYSVDGNSILAVAESIVTQHNLTVPAGLGIPGRNGQIYSSWYPLQSVLAVPFVMTASFATRLLHAPLHFVAAALVGVLPALFTAATVASGRTHFPAAREHPPGRSPGFALFCSGHYSYGLCPHLLRYPLLSLLVASGIYFVFVRTNRTILLAALVALLAVLAKPTGIFLAPALSAYLFLKKTPTRLSLLPALGGSLGVLLYFVYNFVRFANPLTFGQPWVFSFSAFPKVSLVCSSVPDAESFGTLQSCSWLSQPFAKHGKQSRSRSFDRWAFSRLPGAAFLL